MKADSDPAREDDVFLIRMWREKGAPAPTDWRASVIHVGTQQRRYLTNYGELCEFLDRCRQPKARH